MKKFNIETFNKNKIGNDYSFISEDSIIIQQYGNINGYWETIKPKGSLFEEVFTYHKNGNLKSSFKKFSKTFGLGILKEYDKQGNLIKETDLDKPYVYSWEAVKQYLKEHQVNDIEKQVISISRWNDKPKSYWSIDFEGSYNKIKGRFEIILDGKTGEELEVKLFKGKDALGETGTIAVYDTIYKKN